MASDKAVSALGGIAGNLAAEPLSIDDAIADEIAKMPLGHLPMPLREAADIQRITQTLIDLGYEPEMIQEKMQPYLFVQGASDG